MNIKHKHPILTPSGRLKYDRYLSPLDVWAIAFGCIVGWGSFVMPGTDFIPMAGPFGSLLALGAGALIMLIIGHNYSFLMKKMPGTGGTYLYTKRAFGKDHAFICSWFLSLSYVTIVFLNATALFVMARTVAGNALQFGFHYQIAGYDIYFGELLLSTMALVVVALLFIGGKPMLHFLQTTLSLILCAGVLIITTLAIANSGSIDIFSGFNTPDYNPTLGFTIIVLLAPWAYVGFDVPALETSHFRFPVKRSGRIIALSIIFGGLTYGSLTLLSITQVPADFSSWQEYIANLGSLSGVASIPPFYAAKSLFGQTGLIIMVVIALAAMFTGIIGSYRAAARMLSTMAKEKILSKYFLDTPFCIMFIMVISILISFSGRNALVWFVDLTSLGAIIGFGYASGAAWKRAKQSNKKFTMVTGIAGTFISIIFLLVMLISKLGDVDTMSPEAFLLLALWCLLGFVFYWRTVKHTPDAEFRGNPLTSTVLFCLLLYSSLMWYIKSIINIKDKSALDAELVIRSVVLMIIVSIGLTVMLYIQSKLQKRNNIVWREKIVAEEGSKAKTRFLFNMSHDIRTPMNAIIGYTSILMDEKDLPENVRGHIEKIDLSGKHLLTLINDVLEMGMIENGKLELHSEGGDIRDTMNTSYEMFRQQMEDKKISYTLKIEELDHPYLIYDKNRFARVLLNLISNAYKFTPKGGRVSVLLRQTGSDTAGRTFELRVKDSGIGMSKEFAATVFEAFERERTSTVSRTQGTGLGMAITKSIVNAAGGSIRVETEPNKGTEFIVTFRLDICTKEKCANLSKELNTDSIDFSSKRLLLVDDIDINRQLARMLLQKIGFQVETAENGSQAVDMIKASEPGYFDAVLMDIQMPVMNGYEATKIIRSFDDPKKANIPIIAVTANAFGEDVRRAHEEGMNAHIAKPIDPANLKSILSDLLF